MKADIFHGYRFEDDEVHAVLKGYLPFYNRDRLHSSLDYVSPATFEQQARRTGCQQNRGKIPPHACSYAARTARQNADVRLHSTGGAHECIPARSPLLAITCLVVALMTSLEALAQICKPVSQRDGEPGCWITANTTLGQLPQQPIFWHLDTYVTQCGGSG